MSSLFGNFKFQKSKGFTLIEMIVVIGIFTVITGVLLANLPGFRDKSSLDLVAQEVATYIRGAQVYGSSTLIQKNPLNGAFYPAYGLRFIDGQNKFSLYPATCVGTSCSAVTAVKVEEYTLPSNFVLQPCTGNATLCSFGTLDIIFKRPKTQAMFSALGVSSVGIKVKSSKTGKHKFVVVRNNGQITVQDTY